VDAFRFIVHGSPSLFQASSGPCTPSFSYFRKKEGYPSNQEAKKVAGGDLCLVVSLTTLGFTSI